MLLACGLGDGEPNAFQRETVTVDSDASSPTDTAQTTRSQDSGEDTGSGTPGPCPRGMAWIAEAFCMDRYEAAVEEEVGGEWTLASPYQMLSGRTVRAVSQRGQVPQAYSSADQAAAACVLAGKRLCSDSEWVTACEGPDETVWPYGDDYIDGACNDDYDGVHPVVDYFGTTEDVWDSASMNDPGINQQPGTVAPGGDFSDCRSHWGVQDLHGNLHEWVDESSGVFRGGFYADGSFNGNGCTYVTSAHSRTYHDYSTGFRCCQDAP